MPVDADHPFLISAVVATYNAAAYLPELLASLERQSVGIENVQLVFVDDGSTDASGQILDDWATGREGHVTVVHQENQRVAAARNAGLDLARGAWITFPDSDDVLDDGYFAEAAKFATLHGSDSVTLLAAHMMTIDDEGVVADTHPSRKRFEKGSRVVDMLVDPMVQLAVHHAFFRTDLLRSTGVRFDERVRPIFEDAHFIGRYLLLSHTHHLGLVASAKYLYRRRSDGGNLLHSGYDKPERYTNVLRYGELDLLRTASSLGPIPRWVENVVLYDLAWFFRNERMNTAQSAAAPVEVLDEFHDLAGQILRMISPSAVRDFDAVPLDAGTRLALTSGYTRDGIPTDYALLGRVDEQHQQVEVSYWFAGDVPEERWTVDNVDVEPVHATVQDFVYYGRVLVRKRHVWLTRGTDTRVSVNGHSLPFTRSEILALPDHLTPAMLRPHIMTQRRAKADRVAPQESTLQRVRKHARSVYRSTIAPVALARAVDSASIHARKHREAFRDAWVFMDRDTDANDNAEHLYRWVRANRPDINAWFVLRRESADWKRLDDEEFRLVEYGSRAWKALMLNAAHLASSHIDDYVLNPLPADRYGRPRFAFTFLQHGVIHNDLSRWLNFKRADVFVTSTQQEYDAIAGPSQYKFSSKEVVLSGLPRHDALIARRDAGAERDLIVVLPTWRHKLMGVKNPKTGETRLIPGFRDSDYVQQFEALLGSEELRSLAERHRKTVAFMPHPNLRPYLSQFSVPNHVRLLDFATDGVQDVLARAAVFVTDYSSVAFDAAVVGAPIVYFQFDADQFFRGGHTVRRGYFTHEHDGFGPVVHDLHAVLAEVRASAERGWRPDDMYAQRAAEAFVAADGRSCERVISAMLGLAAPIGDVPTTAQLEAQTVSQ